MSSLKDKQLEATKKAIENNKGKKELIGIWTYKHINPLLPKSYRMDSHRCGLIFRILIKQGISIKKTRHNFKGIAFVEYEASTTPHQIDARLASDDSRRKS